jgi:DNA polymerase, archaea type
MRYVSYFYGAPWDDLPVVQSIEKGLLLDGYFDRSNNCIYLIFVVFNDNQKGELVQFIDPTGQKVIRYKGKIDQTKLQSIDVIQDFQYKELYNPLKDQPIIVTDIAFKSLEVNPRSIKQLNGYQIIESFRSDERLQYFTYHQITPGLWYRSTNETNKRLELIEIDRSNTDDIRIKLAGESKVLIDLAVENFPKLDSIVPQINQSIIAFDIEVKAPRNKFPVPEEAAYPIHSIALATSNQKKVLINSNKPIVSAVESALKDRIGYEVTIKYFLYEEDMIQYFLNLAMEYPFHISFNGDNFDLPYLNNRLLKLGFVDKSLIYQSNKSEWHIKNSIHIDLMTFFKNPSIRLYAFSGAYSSHSLDAVAEALLSHKKIEHEKWFDEMSIEELVEYSITDANLTFKLMSFADFKVFKLMILLSRLGNMPLNSLIRRSISAWIYQWVAFEHARRGYIIPPRKEIIKAKGDFESKSMAEGKGYQGAIVLDPNVGVWESVHVYDFASLYPSIIKQKNLSYDTVRCQGSGHEICRANKAPTLSHYVCRRKTGIMSSLVGMVRDLRVKWYKHQQTLLERELKELKSNDSNDSNDSNNSNEANRTSIEIQIDFISMIAAALKVFINASYGVIGNKSFPIFCPPVAECTTDYSRHALLMFKEKVDESIDETINSDTKVVYGDTDSLFIAKPDEKKMNEIVFEQSIVNGMDIDRDDIFAILVLIKKKNYFGVTVSGKNVIKGLTGKKSNTPQIVRNTFNEVMQQYKKSIEQSFHSFNHGSIDRSTIKEEVIKIVSKVMDDLRLKTVPIEDLQSMYRINKKLEDFTGKSVGVTLALQRINIINQNNQDEEDQSIDHSIEQGLIMWAVKTTPFPLLIRRNIFKNLPVKIGDIIKCNYKEISQSLNQSEIDWDYYMDVMRKTLQPLLHPLSIDWNQDIMKNKSLSDFDNELFDIFSDTSDSINSSDPSNPSVSEDQSISQIIDIFRHR